MKRLVFGPLCLGILGVVGGACSAGSSGTTTTTSGGSTASSGAPGSTVTTGGSAMSSGGAPASTGGSTATSGGASSSSGGATIQPRGGAPGAGGTIGSSGPPGPIGGFSVTITPGQFGMKDPTCGVQAFKRERKPTEVILVLDRSASMKEKPDGSTVGKWDMVKPAITGAITATNAALSWGLKLYPEGDGAGSCNAVSIVPLIHVPVAANNAMTVVSAINATTPEGDGTPTGDAIKFATDHLKSRANDNNKFILLATDGDPSCPSGDSAITYAVTNITAALTAGFPTFVVGVDMKSSVDRLNRMATAGGRPRPITAANPAAFYPASTQAELTAALQTITGSVASCVFELNPPPPVPDNIAVDFNGQRAARDPARMNGWEYTSPAHTSLEVFGAFCETIKKEPTNQVDIKYGCPGVPIPLPG